MKPIHQAHIKPITRTIKSLNFKMIPITIPIPLAPMGVLAPVSVHAGPSAQPPIGTIGNFPARVSAEPISPNFPIFKIGLIGGVGWIPQISFSLDS